MALAGIAGGCASFTNVRSAQVKNGFAVWGQWTQTGDMGDDASYMWTGGQLDDCAPCSHSVSTLDVSVRKGIRATNSPRAYELALGVTGISHLYGEGFVGWNQDGRIPFGVGGRASITQAEGRDFRIDGRTDIRVIDAVRVLLGTGMYYHQGKPDGSWLIAHTPGVGLDSSAGPIFAVVVGRLADRSWTAYGSNSGAARAAGRECARAGGECGADDSWYGGRAADEAVKKIVASWRRESNFVRAFQAAQVVAGLSIAVMGTWAIAQGLPPTLHRGLIAQGCGIVMVGLIITVRGIGARGAAIDAVRTWYEQRRAYIDAYHAGETPQPGSAVDRLREELYAGRQTRGKDQ